MPLDANDISSLYRSHARNMLVFFTRRVYDPEVALDLTAETFAAAFSVRDQFRGEGGADGAAWIYGIAHHQLGRYWRRGRVERRALAKIGVEPRELTESEYDRIVELAGLEELRARVAEALALLPDAQRSAIQLRVVEERSYAEVAAKLGTSEQVVRARVSRGLRALAAASVSVQGGDPLPSELGVEHG